MKLLVLLFLVGCATANIHEALEEEAEYVYQTFMLDLEDSGALKEALGIGLIEQAEDDIKTEMGKRLRETLDEILEKIRDSIDKGKSVSEDLQTKLKEVREKMKELKVDLGNKAKELLEKLRERVKNFWKDMLDKLTKTDKRSIDDDEFADFNFKDMFNKLKKLNTCHFWKDMLDKLTKTDKRSIDDDEFADFNFKDMFNKLKKLIMDKIDKEKLKAKIEEIFGKGNEMADSLLELLNKHGDKYKQKLLDLIDRYLGKKEQEKRSLREYWEKIKEYFKNLQIELKEKYMKFGEWVKNQFKEGLDKSKTKIENIKAIAKEFIDHYKNVSKDVAVEAREFLKPYKDDLGALWDQVKDAVQDIIKKED